MKQDTQNSMKRVNADVDQMQVLVSTSKGGMKINADVNKMNCLIKEFVIKNLFGILVTVNVNLINHVILLRIQIMKSANAQKNQLMNYLNDIKKMLKNRQWIS